MPCENLSSFRFLVLGVGRKSPTETFHGDARDWAKYHANSWRLIGDSRPPANAGGAQAFGKWRARRD